MFTGSMSRLISGSVIAVAIACAVTTAQAAPSTAASSISRWVSSATRVGDAPSDRSVTIAMHLAVKDSAGLKQLVADVSSPASNQYGRYLSSADFDARFAPSAADALSAKAFLEHAGMTHVTVGPHSMYVTATATVGQLRTTFKVSQSLYSFKGRQLRANQEEPTLPASLAGKVLFIEGLDDTNLFRHHNHVSETMGELVAPTSKPASDGEADISPATTAPPVAANNPSPYCNTIYGAGALVGTLTTAADMYGASIPWLGCGYTPQQIQAAYGLNKVKFNGTGVTVAITDAYGSPTIQQDGNRYAANHHLPQLTASNFTQIVPPGIYDVSPSEPCGPYGWWGEESLDVAAVHGAAPGANIVYVGSQDCNVSLTVAMIDTVVHHVADVVTNSWSYGSEGLAPGASAMYDQAFLAGAAQGVTVLFSTGDNGDLAELNGAASGSWPSTSTYVTGVGGTSLLIQDASGDKAEYGWGTYRDFLNNAQVNSASSITTSGLQTTSANGVTFDAFLFYSGAGGGISMIEPQPSYQASAVPHALATTLNLATGIKVPLDAPQRVSPDVAMVADPYTGYLYGETFTIAGSAITDYGCTPISKYLEYCEEDIGGTSLSSPLMAGVIAVLDQARRDNGLPVVGFANPLLYSEGSKGNGMNLTTAGLNQIVAPKEPVSVLRAYQSNLTEVRVVTINSVPLQITTAPYAIQPCAISICLGLNDIFNYTSLAKGASSYITPAGYNDVTGLGVPYLPKLLSEQ